MYLRTRRTAQVAPTLTVLAEHENSLLHGFNTQGAMLALWALLWILTAWCSAHIPMTSAWLLPAALLTWCSAAFGCMALRYTNQSAGAKQPTGDRQPGYFWLFLPARAVTRAIVTSWAWFTGEPAYGAAYLGERASVPTVLYGRVPLNIKRDLPPHTQHVLDMQDELDVDGDMHAAVSTYHCLPCLDDTFPFTVDTLAHTLAPYVMECVPTPTSRLYIHCLFGHNRSAVCAAIVAAVLFDTTAADQLALMQFNRPNVHATVRQLELANNVVRTLREWRYILQNRSEATSTCLPHPRFIRQERQATR
jgi:hypothetical protein